MKTFTYYVAVVGVLAFGAPARADHDKACKNIHGKVTVVTQDGIAVEDKLYKVGDSTRIMKNDQRAKLSQISAGDIVCVDIRGRNDIGGGEIAAVTVLNASDPFATSEKQYVREKVTVRQGGHENNCPHIHGKVTRVHDSIVFVNDKPYACLETTRISKDNQTATLKTIKTGDFVCLDPGDDKDGIHTISKVTVLAPSEAAPFESREVIRESEKVKEKIREEK